VPLVAGIASAAAGASGIAVGVLAGLLAPQPNITVNHIHSKLPIGMTSSVPLKPREEQSTTSSVPVKPREEQNKASSVPLKPREGPRSGVGAFLWWVPLLLGLVLLGCLLGLLASHWHYLTAGCCSHGQEYDEMDEEELTKDTAVSQEMTLATPRTFTTGTMMAKQPNAAFFAAVPQMMMQVPLVPAVAVASLPPNSEMGSDSMPRDSRAVQRGTPEAFAPVAHASARGLRAVAGSPQGSAPGSPVASPRGTFRNPVSSRAPGCKSPGYTGSFRAISVCTSTRRL